MRVPFVDRSAELEYLVELAERGSPFPLFVYGPEGCGKTRLLEEVRDRLRGRGFAVVYVDAKESTVERALRGSSSEFTDLLAELSAEAGAPAGRAVVLLVSKLVALYERRFRFRGKRVVVMVDEVVEGVGLESVERYAKILHDLIAEVVEDLGAESMCVVATTSEGLSRELLSRHSYLHLSYLWNLGREAFEELAEALGAPESLVDTLYAYTSGNPRALIELAFLEWNTSRWIEMIYREKVAPLKYERVVAENIDDLEKLVEDPDSAFNVNPGLRRLLVERNMIAYLGNPLTPSTKPRPSRDLGVGEYFAWQLNAYRVLVGERIVGRALGRRAVREEASPGHGQA